MDPWLVYRRNSRPRSPHYALQATRGPRRTIHQGSSSTRFAAYRGSRSRDSNTRRVERRLLRIWRRLSTILSLRWQQTITNRSRVIPTTSATDIISDHPTRTRTAWPFAPSRPPSASSSASRLSRTARGSKISGRCHRHHYHHRYRHRRLGGRLARYCLVNGLTRMRGMVYCLIDNDTFYLCCWSVLGGVQGQLDFNERDETNDGRKL